jgi:AAA15 family ATPase/GTPase
MKIKSLQLKNFKRFTDLTLQDIPDNAKLVLLIGSNGSGKSSVFDAFERISTFGVDFGIENYSTKNEYYSKNKNFDYLISLLSSEGEIIKNNSSISVLGQTKRFKNNFYGRTSFRQIPRLTRTSLGNTNFDIEKNSDRPKAFIDRDTRFENDIENILGKLLKEFFRTSDDKSEIKKNVIDPINESLSRIFNKENGTKIELLEIIPPLEGKTAEINFKKGDSIFHYNFLSAGEKEVFNILINFVARGEYYKDTIFFFDEIDLHLNTKLQYNFLKEIIENWIPDNCQFWTASHSLGFIQYATDYEDGVIIDFDDLDFDKKQTLLPQPKDSLEIFEIAVSKAFIDQVVQGRKIIFSENTDTPFYNDLNIAKTLFFVAIDKIDVFHKSKNLKQSGLIDRDYLSNHEVAQLKKDYPNLFLLPYYSFENLLYHPDNLEEYYKGVNKPFDKQSYIKQIAGIKNNERDYLAAGIIQARGGYPFYKENENAKKLKAFKENYKEVIDLLRSDDFETFYKVFPAKDYGRDIPERMDLSVSNLAKTNWFKTQIENIIK